MTDQPTNHIWQYKDLDVNTTSICYVEKKNIDNVTFLCSKTKDIESETKCQVTLHGIENQNGIVWIRIKNSCPDLRRFAILLINSYANNSIKEIVLPKMEEKSSSIKRKKTLIRSCTENSIASNVNLNPFSSILMPFAEEIKIDSRIQSREMNLSNNQTKVCPLSETKEKIENKEIKKRYTLDFLLTRSTMPESKKLPRNWKELNIMYPNICFVGTVLSYFNASKYYDHWIRIQNENPELHNPVETLTNIQYLNLSQDRQSNPGMSKNNNSSLMNAMKINNPVQTYFKSKTKTNGCFSNHNPNNKADIRFFSALNNKSQKASKKLYGN